MDQASAQLTLLSRAGAGPQGLRYEPDFISENEEAELIRRARALPLTPFQFGAFEGKRRVASFGWRCDYSEQRLVQAADLPPWAQPFIARVEAFAGLQSGAVEQVLCTEYAEGAGIGWHRDKPHYGQVFGTLEVQPRSLYMMAGESRHVWEHSIPPVGTARYSITFRTMA